QSVASLTATALRNAHRFETLLRAQQESSSEKRQAELRRIALVAFLRRLFERVATTDDQSWAETLLPRASDEELERLVSVTMQVLDEESRGGAQPDDRPARPPRPRRPAPRAARAREPRVLRPRSPHALGRRLRSTVPRAAGARGDASRAPHRGLPDAAR